MSKHQPHHSIKYWTEGLTVEAEAQKQLANVASLPFIYKHIAVMPDVHWGKGATVGSVIPTRGAIIPAAVGVDIGCGMLAAKLNLMASDLPDNLYPIRLAIEQAVPHGRTHHGGPNDKGAWQTKNLPDFSAQQNLSQRLKLLVSKHPKLSRAAEKFYYHLGTLGTGNHFIELCLDKTQGVWLMLHSGSRGIGNAIGTYFIELAKRDMRQHLANLPDEDLAYFQEGAQHFDDYWLGLEFAQDYARSNRQIMFTHVLKALRNVFQTPIEVLDTAINCHHNYASREQHFGEQVYVTRKGAVRARLGELGIIPGSMGTASYIVRGKGNSASFHSCSHGAGRLMSRNAAKKQFSLADHERATRGIECRKDKDVIDETPQAYKDIAQVIAAQSDLIEVVYELRQVVCVKG